MAEELSFQEIDELLESVIHNKKLSDVESEKGEVFVILCHPSSDEILTSRYVRGTSLTEAKEAELPSREEIIKVVEKQREGSGDKEKIVKLEAVVAAQTRLLSLTKIKARRDPIEERIENLNLEIQEINNKTDSLYIHTQEFRADEASLWFLTWAGTYSLSGEKYWDTFESFEQETDLALRASLFEKFAVFNRGVDTSLIRLLARHVLWRIRYTAGLKIGGSLFSQDLCNITPDQQSLLYWSNYYQSIYEMMPDEQPDDSIIGDDDALDAYMERYFKDREADRNQGRLKRGSGSKGKLSTSEKDEVLVTSNNPEFLQMEYSEKRVQAPEGGSEVEVISPNSRRARNRRGLR